MMAFHATQAWADGADLILEIAIYSDGQVFDDLRLDRLRAGTPTAASPAMSATACARAATEVQPQLISGPAIELQQVHPNA